MSPLVLAEILGLFVNTLTADDKYRVQDCENLQPTIQIIQKTKKIFWIFCSISGIYIKF